MRHIRLMSGLTGSAVLVFVALGISTVYAETRDAPDGYAISSSSDIVRTTSGGCVHTSEWTQDLATIVGCDGVILEPEVRMIEGQGTGVVAEIIIPTAALFAFDSAELSSEGEAEVGAYRDDLVPELAAAEAGIIIGHTDSTGDPAYNKQLSLQRAEAVRDYLVANGVAAEKLRVVGRGADDPIASNETPEGQAENRRVEVIVVGELRGLDAMLFPSAALFPRRSAELTEAGRASIETQREIAIEQLRRAPYIEVVGHTDDIGDDAYNQELSEQRAATVADYLVATGTEAEKIWTVGAGEREPIASNSTPEGRSQNRRVEVFVLGRTR
jgi:OOP family OmpA-OmpF porin